MGLFDRFRTKKTSKPIINEAVDNKNSALNDLYAYQNQKPTTPADDFPNLIGKKKGKK